MPRESMEKKVINIINIFTIYLERRDFNAEVVELKGSVKDRLKTIKSTLDKRNIDIKI